MADAVHQHDGHGSVRGDGEQHAVVADAQPEQVGTLQGFDVVGLRRRVGGVLARTNEMREFDL